MARLINFELDSQTTVLVEAADDGTLLGQQHVSASGGLTEKANEAFDAALAGIKPIARSIMAQLQEAAADAKGCAPKILPRPREAEACGPVHHDQQQRRLLADTALERFQSASCARLTV
jgi:hypothetical protein